MPGYPIGKLPSAELARLLTKYTPNDPRVVISGSVGEDAAVIDIGDRYLVAKTDPITFATDEIGWYAVHVNANDIACTGASPRWFLVTEPAATRTAVTGCGGIRPPGSPAPSSSPARPRTSRSGR